MKFFRIIVECILQEKKMNLPLKFVWKHGDQLSNEATLMIPNGRFWKIKLGRENGEIFLGDGLEEFFQFYSICFRYLLIFKYRGFSNFSVQILDKTACEIQYHPFSAAAPHEQQQAEMYETKGKGKKTDKSFKRPKSEAKSGKIGTLHAKVEKEEKIFVSARLNSKLSKMSPKTKKLVEAVKNMKPRNPSFLVFLMDSTIINKTINVPAGFANRYMRDACTKIKVQNADGKQWIINTTFHWTGSNLKLQKGWTWFYMDNCLKSGDVCLFELVQKTQVVLKVSIFSC